MTAIRFAVLGLAALVAAACLPVTTKHPVGQTVGFKADPALIGLWKGRGEQDKDAQISYFAFVRNEQGDGMTAILVTPGTDADDWGTFDLKLANLGANRYMNVREGLKNGKPNDEELAQENILLRYAVGKDGKLTLSLLDDKASAEAVNAHKIAGSVGQGSMGDVHITAEPAEQDAFFAKPEAGALFSQKLIVLTKVQ
jgi:hypothetical protein